MKRIKMIDKNGKTLYAGWLRDLPLEDEQVKYFTETVYHGCRRCISRTEAVKSAMRARLASFLTENTVLWQNIPLPERNYVRYAEKIVECFLYDE